METNEKCAHIGAPETSSEAEKQRENRNLSGTSAAQISFFNSVKDTTPAKTITIGEFINSIKNGEWADIVNKVRAIENKEERDKFKVEHLPAVTIGGTFSQRGQEKLIDPSNFICIDFDNLEDIDTARALLYADPYTYAGFISVSGNGLAIIVKIPAGANHKEAYQSLSDYYQREYGLTADPAPKNIASLRFCSFNPEICSNSESNVTILEPQKEAVKLPEMPRKTATLDGLGSRYGMAALSGLIDEVRKAQIGQRNYTLNGAAFRFGQLVAGGELSENGAEQIKQAARMAGLYDTEIKKTFNSGFTAGKHYPKSAQGGQRV